jgi:hypothetical protein
MTSKSRPTALATVRRVDKSSLSTLATLEELTIMFLPSHTKIAVASVIALLLAGIATSAESAERPHDTGISPALCGPGGIKESGIQGEVPAGQTANYNCGVKLVGQLPLVGNVQWMSYAAPRP